MPRIDHLPSLHFLLPNLSDRLPRVSAALIRPFETLESAGNAAGDTPFATTARFPCTRTHDRQKNPLARASPLSPRCRQIILEPHTIPSASCSAAVNTRLSSLPSHVNKASGSRGNQNAWMRGDVWTLEFWGKSQIFGQASIILSDTQNSLQPCSSGTISIQSRGGFLRDMNGTCCLGFLLPYIHLNNENAHMQHTSHVCQP